jgi:hypothetical protein
MLLRRSHLRFIDRSKIGNLFILSNIFDNYFNFLTVINFPARPVSLPSIFLCVLSLPRPPGRVLFTRDHSNSFYTTGEEQAGNSGFRPRPIAVGANSRHLSRVAVFVFRHEKREKIVKVFVRRYTLLK